jgi:hypothetical protein
MDKIESRKDNEERKFSESTTQIRKEEGKTKKT